MTIESSYYRTVRDNPFIVGYWRLNDKAGSKAQDWANKYNLNGTISQPAYTGSGPPMIVGDESAGSYGVFGGSLVVKNNIEVAYNAKLALTYEICLEVWVSTHNVLERKEITGTRYPLIGKLNSEANKAAPYALDIEGNGKVAFRVGNGITEKKLEAAGLEESFGKASHIVAQIFEEEMSIYINGTLVGTQSISGQEIKDAGYALFMFTNPTESETAEHRYYFMGEIAVYSKALGKKEIENHFRLGKKINTNPYYVTTFDTPTYS